MKKEVADMFLKVEELKRRYTELEKEYDILLHPIQEEQQDIENERGKILAELFKKHFIQRAVWIPTDRHYFNVRVEDKENMKAFASLAVLDYHDQVSLDDTHDVYFRVDDGDIILKFDSYQRVGEYAKKYGMKIDFEPLKKKAEELGKEKKALEDIIDKIETGSSWYNNGEDKK